MAATPRPEMTPPEVDDAVLDAVPEVDPVAARRFATGFGIASLLLLLLFAYLNIVLPRQLYAGAAITVGEAEALERTMGLVDKAMKIEQRKGHTVLREATPNPPPVDPFGQDVTLTVTTPEGQTTVYKVRYALERIPTVESGDRLVRLYPLNRAGEQLLRDLELPFEAPDPPLTE